jgi:AcrR family transcriptional regulator
MRITKDPQERKQEILETAMRLFQEKGYEKISISDIAKAIGVAQGLCYWYFPSKEVLFDEVVDQYATMQVQALSATVKKDMTLKQILEGLPVTVETDDDAYYQLFHGVENLKFHD